LVSGGGVPKLLDFGIAKLLERDTSGRVADATLPVDHMMTPDYASPEQIRGEVVTTASDVYSLGVLLYELLADRRPLPLSGMAPAQMLKAIDTEPQKPSEAAPRERARHLAGDLDTIVLKAMHRSPERRYSSAQQLGDDIRRYLAGLPVHARPDTIAYRVRKYAERHRAVVLAICLSTIAVAGGLLTAVWQTGVAASKEAEARRRFGEIRELAAGLLGEVDASLENLPGATAAREILARKVLHYLDELAKDQVRDAKLQTDLAAAYERLGDILGGPKASNLGKSSAALDAYRKALSIYERQGGTVDSVPHRSRALSKISDVLAVTGDHAGAIAEELKALAIREAWLRANPTETAAKRAVASSLQELAGDYDRLGRFSDALENRRRVLFIIQGIRATTTPDTSLNVALALAHKRLGRSLIRNGQIPAAMAHFNTAIDIERAELARNPVGPARRANLAFSLQDMGLAHEANKEYARALPYFEEALRLRTDLSKADSNDWRVASTVASSRLHVGACMVKAGNPAGVPHLEQALASRQQLAARSPWNMGARAEVGEAHAALADAYAHLGHDARARPLYEEALTIYDELSQKGSLSAEVAGDRERLGRLLGR
jgi:non-specific serine/threonine protein kinase/serine/threonine-protein kinase